VFATGHDGSTARAIKLDHWCGAAVGGEPALHDLGGRGDLGIDATVDRLQPKLVRGIALALFACGCTSGRGRDCLVARAGVAKAIRDHGRSDRWRVV